MRAATPCVPDLRTDPVMSRRIDVLRTAMILFVVAWHVAPPIPVTSRTDFAWESFRAFAMTPRVFLIPSCLMVLTTITGYVLFSNPVRKSYRRNARNWARSLLVPFFAFGAPLVALLFVLQSAGFAHVYRYQLVPWSWPNLGNALFGLTDYPINVPLYFLRNVFVLLLTAPLVGWMTKKFGPALLVALFLIMATQPPIPYFGRWSMPLGFALGAYIAQRPSFIAFAEEYGAVFLMLSVSLSSLVLWQMLRPSAAGQELPRGLMSVVRVTAIAACWWLVCKLIPQHRGSAVGAWRGQPIARGLVSLTRYSFAIFCLHVPVLEVLRKTFDGFFVGTQSTAYPAFFLCAAPVTVLLCVAVAAIGERVAPRAWAFAMGRRTRAAQPRPYDQVTRTEQGHTEQGHTEQGRSEHSAPDVAKIRWVHGDSNPGPRG